MPAHHVIRLGAVLLEALEYVTVLAAHHVRHLHGEDEGRTFTIEAELALEVPQEVPKIYVKEVASFTEHYIARVAVTYAFREIYHKIYHNLGCK